MLFPTRPRVYVPCPVLILSTCTEQCFTQTDMMLYTGKSAGMIMRQINADALAEAKTLHLEQTCDLLQACHLRSDANVVEQKPVHSSGSPAPFSHLGVR